MSLSPDGGRAAIFVDSLEGRALWVYDLKRGTPTALNQDGEAGFVAQWSPDGQRLAYRWIKDGRAVLAWQRADGTDKPEVLASGSQLPSSWMPDNRRLMEVSGTDLAGPWSFWLAVIEKSHAVVQRLTESPKFQTAPELSPDGQWLAYVARLMKRAEVYIRPFPGSGVPVQLSLEGGYGPAWRRDGRELFFVEPSRGVGTRPRMMAVDISLGPAVRVGTPHPLFEIAPGLSFGGGPIRVYDVSPDGQRFYAMRIAGDPAPPPVVTHINLIQNWFEELKAKVPVAK